MCRLSSVRLTRRGALRAAVGAAAVVNYSAAGLFLSTYRAAPLERPAPFDGALPEAAPPPRMAVRRILTGYNHRTAAFGYRGGAFTDQRQFAMTAVLVKHPRGDLLIDTGLGRDIDAQFQLMPWSFRAITKPIKTRSAADQLAADGYNPLALKGILLTHAHWDHVSGVSDFPGVPVLLPTEERRWIDEGGGIMAIAQSMTDADWATYGFEGGPYLGFARSHDVYGDGSVVTVPAPGHTPGSVIVFVALPDGQRFAFVGDVAWQREGITEREERPWLQRNSDADPARERTSLLQMAAVAERFPGIILAPAHDARGCC